jgi:hypothetical protein
MVGLVGTSWAIAVDDVVNDVVVNDVVDNVVNDVDMKAVCRAYTAPQPMRMLHSTTTTRMKTDRRGRH